MLHLALAMSVGLEAAWRSAAFSPGGAFGCESGRRPLVRREAQTEQAELLNTTLRILGDAAEAASKAWINKGWQVRKRAGHWLPVRCSVLPPALSRERRRRRKKKKTRLSALLAVGAGPAAGEPVGRRADKRCAAGAAAGGFCGVQG